MIARSSPRYLASRTSGAGCVRAAEAEALPGGSEYERPASTPPGRTPLGPGGLSSEVRR